MKKTPSSVYKDGHFKIVTFSDLTLEVIYCYLLKYKMINPIYTLMYYFWDSAGEGCTNKREFLQAKEHYTRALRYAEKLNDRYKIGMAHACLGYINGHLSLREKEVEHSQRALECFQHDSNAIDKLFTLYVNFARMSIGSREFGLADEMINKAQYLLDHSKDKLIYYVPMNEATRAQYYFYQSKYDEAEKHCMNALSMYKNNKVEKHEGYAEMEELMTDICKAKSGVN